MNTLVSIMANNQYIVNTSKGAYFQSYNSLIGFEPNDGSTPTLTSKWDYSATTLKYTKQFLGTTASKKQIQQMIDEGSIILDDNLEVK